MFAPTLFIGAMIGGAVGGLEHHFFPLLSASVAPFALVGMGTFLQHFCEYLLRLYLWLWKLPGAIRLFFL